IVRFSRASLIKSAFVKEAPRSVTKAKSSAKIRSIIAMSLALTAFWYTVSNAATVCASRVGGGDGSGVEGMCVLGEAAATLCFGKANGAVSDRRESSGGVGIG